MHLRTMAGPLALLACAALSAQTAGGPHYPSNEELRHFRSLGAPRLSPDGKQVLIQVHDATADGGRPHLWLAAVDGSPCRQLTYAPAGAEKDSKYHGETSGEWMPDGESILFLSHRGEHTQLFRLPMQGGEAAALDLKVTPQVDDSKLPGAVPPDEKKNQESASKSGEPAAIDVSGFAIAPNGKAIAVWAKDPQTPGEKKQHDEKADAEWVDHETHATRLYLLDPTTNKLTSAAVPSNVGRVSWSAQSDRLVAEVEAPNGMSDLGPARSTWLVLTGDLAHPSKLALPATAHTAGWSLDGKNIFFTGQAEADAPPGYSDLFEFSVAGSKTRNLSHGFEGSIAGGDPIAELNGTVLEGVENGLRLGIASFGSTRAAPEPIAFEAPVVHDLNTNQRRSGWVYLASSSTHPDALYFRASLTAEASVLPTPPMAPEHTMSVVSKAVHWTSDGRTIDGLLYLPEDTGSKRIPLIVEVHGGPTGAWRDGYDPFAGFLAGQGWAVLKPNPRGSTGRGEEFVSANKNDLGSGDYRDIMAGVDAVLKEDSLDGARMALIGYSYGGEMAGFVEGKTTRFKAIVSGAPVINQFSEYGTEGDSWYDRWFFGKPWEHLEDAWRQSPVAGVPHASTPFLLLQGEEDKVDPLGQSQEMYRALRQMGVPVELVEYPREDHGPLAGGIFGRPSPEPWHGFDARQRIVEFIRKAFDGER